MPYRSKITSDKHHVCLGPNPPDLMCFLDSMSIFFVSVGFFLRLVQPFQGLSGSIGSNPERRFLQETYRLESQDVWTGAASKWEAHGIPTPHRWPHKEWNLTAKELETPRLGPVRYHFSNPADSYRTSLQTRLEVPLCLNCISLDSWNNWHSDLNTEVLPFLRCHHSSSSGNQGLVGVASNWAMEMHR